MMGCKNRVSCRNLYRRLEILPFVSQYILSRMLFSKEQKSFYFEFKNYTKSTIQINDLYQPITNFYYISKGSTLHGH